MAVILSSLYAAVASAVSYAASGAASIASGIGGAIGGSATAGAAGAAVGGSSLLQGAALGLGSIGLSKLMQPPKLDLPKPPPAANPPTLADASALQRKQDASMRAGAGFSNTIQNVGGPQGLKLGDTGLAEKTLLG